ncbi:MAG TPA: cysteine desulfurase family protein [Drouetiella sp.]
MKANIYLDNSATTPVRPPVFAVPSNLCYGNPSSIHHAGRQARAAIEIARQKVANLLGAKVHEIYFTPSATYSNNVALLGRARYVEQNGLGRHMITTGIEHSSALGPARYLESQGWKVTILDVDSEGFVDARELERAITADTSIISIMWANNEVGTVQSIEQLAEIARAHNIFFHTDAVQAAGKIAIDLKQVPADTLSITGHKLHAPKGIGALFIREGVQILPIIFGGGQEGGLFPGTEGVSEIMALGEAAEIALSDMERNQSHLRRLQKILTDKFASLPNINLTGALDPSKRIPGHVSVVVRGAVGEQIVETADEHGIAISSVSACSGRHPSHVLKQMGYTFEEGLGSARITASVLNTVEECELAAKVLADIFVNAVKGSSVGTTIQADNTNVYNFEPPARSQPVDLPINTSAAPISFPA